MEIVDKIESIFKVRCGFPGVVRDRVRVGHGLMAPLLGSVVISNETIDGWIRSVSTGDGK